MERSSSENLNKPTEAQVMEKSKEEAATPKSLKKISTPKSQKRKSVLVNPTSDATPKRDQRKSLSSRRTPLIRKVLEKETLAGVVEGKIKSESTPNEASKTPSTKIATPKSILRQEAQSACSAEKSGSETPSRKNKLTVNGLDAAQVTGKL